MMALTQIYYLLAVGFAVLLGVALHRFLGRYQQAARFTSAFAAGVLLALCFLFLLPESLSFWTKHSRPDQNASAIGYAISLGFLLLLTIERYLLRIQRHVPCTAPSDDHDHHLEPILDHRHEQGAVWSMILALSIHSFFDGVALYTAQQQHSIELAVVVGIILHKIPEAASLLTVLRRSGVKTKHQIFIFLLYAISTPLGTIIANQIHDLISGQKAALLTAFAAGALLHLVTGHLLPEATESDAETKNQKGWVYLIMLAGFLVLSIARLFSND